MRDMLFERGEQKHPLLEDSQPLSVPPPEKGNTKIKNDLIILSRDLMDRCSLDW
jgi:hypothetical protein